MTIEGAGGVYAERLVSLQVMRALAALAIVLHHTLADAASLAAAAGRNVPMAFLIDKLAAGVDIFFVISGFVMVHASRDLFGARGAARTFLRRRLVRIAPLYWLVTTMFLIVAWRLPGDINTMPGNLEYVVKSYLFVPAARPDGAVLPVVSLGWTLNYEMMFYTVFACVLGLRRQPAVLTLCGVLLAIVVAGFAMRPQSVPLQFWTSPMILEFAFGAVLAELRLRGARLGLPVCALSVALGLAMIALLPVPAAGLERAFYWGMPSSLIIAAATLARAKGCAVALSPLAALGDASYALYLTHPFAMRAMKGLWSANDLTATLGVSMYVATAAAAAILLAFATYRFVERPVIAALRD